MPSHYQHREVIMQKIFFIVLTLMPFSLAMANTLPWFTIDSFIDYGYEGQFTGINLTCYGNDGSSAIVNRTIPFNTIYSAEFQQTPDTCYSSFVTANGTYPIERFSLDLSTGTSKIVNPVYITQNASLICANNEPSCNLSNIGNTYDDNLEIAGGPVNSGTQPDYTCMCPAMMTEIQKSN